MDEKKFYNCSLYNNAEVRKVDGKNVITGPAEIYLDENLEERLRLSDNTLKYETTCDRLLFECPFNSVLFWNWGGKLGDNSLAYSTNLVEVEFSAHPGTPLILGDYAMAECPSLSRVRFQNGLSEIGEYAFYNCPALAGGYLDKNTSIFYKDCAEGVIRMPNTLKKIGHASFYGCLALRIIEVPKDCVIVDEKDGYLPVGDFMGPNNTPYNVWTRIVRY